MEKLGDMGEHEVIRRLSAMLESHPDLMEGAGDDCAVCSLPNTGSDQVFTTDPVIENVHFGSHEEPERIGNKAVGRVLSDIAAMGAQPQWILVNVVAPPELEFQYLEKIYEGMITCCGQFDATIIGGDLAQGSSFELHLFGTGLLPAGSALLRSGANPDDAIFVTGQLGESARGKHLDFVPRVEEGIFLRESGFVTAMMDISDGLATDLRHMLKQSGVGALLNADCIPKVGTLDRALYDGEDFELLFTVPSADATTLARHWKNRFETDLSKVGTITEETGLLNLQFEDGKIQTIDAKAFEHFSSELLD